MSAVVNLLLLLSALLSALTGVGGGVRAAQAPVVVTQVAVSASSSRQVSPAAQARPVAALPALGDVRAIHGPAWRIAPTAPLYLSRRRE